MSSTFSVTRDQIINGALRVLGVIGQTNSPTTSDLTNGSEALNMLIKQVMVEGLDLWTYTTLAIPLFANQTTYTIGPSGNVTADRPLRIAHAFIRNSSGYDVSLLQLSRQEYDMYALKSQTGVPNSFYYDPQLVNGVLYLYLTPIDSTSVVYIVVQRPILDINNSSDIPDFPSEWFQYLKFGLADILGPEYDIPLQKQQLITQRAEMYKEKLVDWSQEEASTFFTPNPQMGWR
jgi:hypothetical protein